MELTDPTGNEGETDGDGIKSLGLFGLGGDGAVTGVPVEEAGPAAVPEGTAEPVICATRSEEGKLTGC